MTAAEPAEQPVMPRRDGATDDIAGLRLYYRLAGDPAEQYVDWRNDRGPTIAEAIAVKTATVSKVSLGRMMTVLRTSTGADEDPEALQGLVWMLRRRGGDTSPITDLAGLDLLSIRQEYLDAAAVELDFPDPEPDPAQRALAADIAADLQRHLPTLPLAAALAAAASLIVAAPAPDATEDTEPGEDAAGDEPAAPVKAAPARRAAKRTTTPKM